MITITPNGKLVGITCSLNIYIYEIMAEYVKILIHFVKRHCRKPRLTCTIPSHPGESSAYSGPLRERVGKRKSFASILNTRGE